MREPLVSIGIPVYNGERFLEASIRSNLDQSYRNIEVIISDNGSTDRTEAICRDLAATDARIKVYRNERNVGAAANYNRLFQLSSGEYFRWSNADDLVHPDLVAKVLPVLEEVPDAVIAYGRTCLIDDQGASLGEFNDNLDLREDQPSARYIAFRNQVTLTNIIYGLMRASAVRKTPVMGRGTFPHSDIHFMAAMSLQGKFIEVPSVLFYRRLHERALSSSPAGQEAKTFWAASDRKFVLPTWRFEFAGIAEIVRGSMPAAEKAKLLAFSTKRLLWRRKELTEDLVRLLS